MCVCVCVCVCVKRAPGLLIAYIFLFRDDNFVVSLDLSPGEYSYKFYVDNEWKVNSSQVYFRLPSSHTTS